MKKTANSIILIGLCIPLLAACASGPGASPDFVYSFTDRYPLSSPSVSRIDVAASRPRYGDEQRVRNMAVQFLRSGQGKIVIFVPQEGAGALSSGNWVKQELIAQGVPNSRIQWDTRPMAPGLVRLAYAGGVSRAVWSCTNLNEDVQQRADETAHLNRETINFGCAFQSNLRAQADNPNDFVHPRAESPTDPVRAANAVRRLRTPPQGTNASTTTPAPAVATTTGSGTP
jgi:pilus biogenesis lipoprotein CpaD